MLSRKLLAVHLIQCGKSAALAFLVAAVMNVAARADDQTMHTIYSNSGQSSNPQPQPKIRSNVKTSGKNVYGAPSQAFGVGKQGVPAVNRVMAHKVAEQRRHNVDPPGTTYRLVKGVKVRNNDGKAGQAPDNNTNGGWPIPTYSGPRRYQMGTYEYYKDMGGKKTKPEWLRGDR